MLQRSLPCLVLACCSPEPRIAPASPPPQPAAPAPRVEREIDPAIIYTAIAGLDRPAMIAFPSGTTKLPPEPLAREVYTTGSFRVSIAPNDFGAPTTLEPFLALAAEKGFRTVIRSASDAGGFEVVMPNELFNRDTEDVTVYRASVNAFCTASGVYSSDVGDVIAICKTLRPGTPEGR